MGLLDLNTEEGQQALGLLAAAGPRFDGAGFGQRLMEGLQQGQKWKAQQQEMAARKQAMEYQQFHMEQARAQAAAQQAAAQEQARINGILPSLVTPASKGAPAINFDQFQPQGTATGLPGQVAIAPTEGSFNMQEALRQRVPIKTIEELQKLTAGPEYSPEVRYDQDGRAFMTAKNGAVKFLDNIKQRDKLIETDLGGTKGFRTEYSPNLVGSLPKTQSPDSLASNQLGWARFNFEKNGGADAGKPKWDAASGSFVYSPDATNPRGKVVPADGYVKPLGEAAKKTLSGVESLNGAIGEYLNELNSWNKTDALKPDKRAAMGTKYNTMMLQAKEAFNLGVLNGPDYQILQSVVTDPRSMMGAVTSNSALGTQAKELSRIMSKITAPAVRDSGAKAETTQAGSSGKTVVKTGMYGGKKVVQYSDGTTDYAD